MGGSVVTRSVPFLLEKGFSIIGAVVLDVVEGESQRNDSQNWDLAHESIGSAIEALPHMHSLLDSRPDGFQSVEDAIRWQYVPPTFDDH